MRWTRVGAFMAASVLLAPAMLSAQSWEMGDIKPTALYPRPAEGRPLKQRAQLELKNSGAAADMAIRISVKGQASCVERIGNVPAGASVVNIHVPDVPLPVPVLLELIKDGGADVLATKRLTWQPQKKWRIFVVSYAHNDHGYGGYPHRLRTEIRHENILRALAYCRKTDDWEADSKFHYVIEISEPIPSFLAAFGHDHAEELAKRIREGRIQVGGLHSTVATEQLSHELMARLLYLNGRHVPDLLDVPPGRTALDNDVVGITWPLATFLAEAGVPYFFHGHNACGYCLQPAQKEPVFFLQSPDGQSRVLTGSTLYEGGGITEPPERRVLETINRFGGQTPYDVLLVKDASDFRVVKMDNTLRIRAWNAMYAYPRLVSATLDMYFDAVAAQADQGQVKSFAKDSNNQWADQDAADAWNLGIARRLGEEIPAIERFSTISQTLLGGGFPWTDMYQAYHQLLLFHEHTHGRTASGLAPHPDIMKQYETELAENREIVTEARDLAEHMKRQVLNRITDAIATDSERSVVVFNPLARARTDVARIPADTLAGGIRLREAGTEKAVPLQYLADGSVVFVAREIPSMGYRTYSLEEDPASRKGGSPSKRADGLENRYYRIAFDPATGSITSLYDKDLKVELVDQSAPHKFNEYLYQRMEGSDEKSLKKNWYRVEKVEAMSAVSGPIADIMTIRASAKGVERMEQTIMLHHGLKRIDFVLDMVKSPSGRDVMQEGVNLRASNRHKEAVFVALPFAIPDYSFHHELPGAVIEPIRDMFEGAATAHYGIRHFSDVSGPRYGVTVSATESALVEYGEPRSEPLAGGRERQFEKDGIYPANSRMYLYLMNNMFSTNIRLDQRGPMRFTWSIRSHEGDWKAGLADRFGWDTMNPLWVALANGRKSGSLPASAGFVEVDPPHVACLAIKPAEFNGRGFILRFHETQGCKADVTVSMPFAGKIRSARETSLVENDLPGSVNVLDGTRIAFAIRPHGVKTIRLLCGPEEKVPGIGAVKALALSDMEIQLSWQADGAEAGRISHYQVYRGERPDFQPTLLNLVQHPVSASVIDRPHLYYAGWIHNRLEPETTYYYRVAAVDRWNNQGALSAPVRVQTLSSARKNMRPLPVEGLRAVHVSPLAPLNFVNLLWRTSCESDIASYEIYRGTAPGFEPGLSTRVGVVLARDPIQRGRDGHAAQKASYRNNEFDHMMFADHQAGAATTAYYRVCAVDDAGQKGPFSNEATVTTGPAN